MSASKKQISAVSAALKKSGVTRFDVADAVGGDRAVAHDALWSIVRAGKFNFGKLWSAISVLEESAGPVAWADFLTLVRDQSLEGVAPKNLLGHILLGNPTRKRPDLPRELATIALRAAWTDRAAVEAESGEGLTEQIRLVVEYVKGVAGLPLSAEAKKRVLQGLAQGLVCYGIVGQAYLPDPSTGEPKCVTIYSDRESFLSCDPYVLATPFGSRDEWERALADALVEEVKRQEKDRYAFIGIPHLENAEAGLRLLSPEDLALVLATAEGPMEHRPWEAIAKDALARLSPEERARGLATLETSSIFRAERVRVLLRA